MKHRNRSRELWLLAAFVCAAAGVLAALAGVGRTQAEDYAVKLRAAQNMEACSRAVRGYKQQAGLPLSEEDWFQTGLLGESYTGLTTTLGMVEAKRTAASPDMAAMAVALLTEAGVGPGDRVAAGFSGSFPGLNLAVLAACDAIGAECIYIASVGASTYGANQPQMTFPQMACMLADEGLIPGYPAAITPGGQSDCGLDMDPQLLQQTMDSLARWQVPVLTEEDYLKNLEARRRIYEQDGPVDCFVGVGGNITTSGRHQADLGQGVIRPNRVGMLTDGSGLLERYIARGVPVISLLNVKKLTADCGLPFDPQQPVEPGSADIYFRQTLPRMPVLLGLGLSLLCLLRYRHLTREGERAQ